MQHWTITRDADGLAVLVFDKAGTTTNTLSAEALGELNHALDALDARHAARADHPPRQGRTASSPARTSTSSAQSRPKKARWRW